MEQQQQKKVLPIMLIEDSATGRFGLAQLFKSRNLPCYMVASYEDALEILQNSDVRKRFAAIVVGYSPNYNGEKHPLFKELDVARYQDMPILVLSHDADAAIFGWVAKRQSAALLTWDDYNQSVDCLHRLMNLPELAKPKTAAGPKTRILFVDDSRTSRAKFARLLEKHGYDVETACDCAQAMSKAKQSWFDIAIIDYFMPGKNGDILCQMLKQDPDTSHITPAVITGTYLEQVITDTLDAGAVECMFKNEANDLFLARVGAMSRSVHNRNSIEAERHRLAGILASVGEGVYGVDSKGQVTFMNPTACAILGYGSEKEVIGQKAHSLFHYANEHGDANQEESCLLQNVYESGDKIEACQTVFWNSKHNVIPVECTALPLNIRGELEGAVIAFRDITERKQLENELVWQAHHDALTKLHNRRFFEQQLTEEVSRVQRSAENSALLYIDLDRFKYINDTAGHAAGDQLLIEVSQLLKMRLRESDLLARLGGDEFAVILIDTDKTNISAVAESFRDVLEQYHFTHGSKHYRIYGSIGVTLIDKTSTSASDVLANADIACHIAKSRGRNQVHIYSQNSDEKIFMHMQLGWSERLQDALENNGFTLEFQPIIPMEHVNIENLPAGDGELWHGFHKKLAKGVAHYEVLVRYVSDSGERISPNAFLPTAERFGIMPQIDTWVLTHAIEKLAELNASGHHVTFTVNISGETMEPEKLATTIRNLLLKHRLNPNSLIIEITESSAIQNIDAAKKLINELRMMGCRFALDDFGSGFSSFYHLKHLPVDYVKIDGQFVQGMATDPSDRAIVSSINDIAHSFGKKTIAVFVEGPEILNLLKTYGVDYAQGFYVASPQPELIQAHPINYSKLH